MYYLYICKKGTTMWNEMSNPAVLMRIGQRIKETRIRQRITQEELATATPPCTPTACRWWCTPVSRSSRVSSSAMWAAPDAPAATTATLRSGVTAHMFRRRPCSTAAAIATDKLQ